ncbi:MAG: hypothetical protein JNL70_10130 [Saprospiraceae bacterium]|nr:hypothetical protein [Saprospiraceae bacterium]
MTNEQLTAYLQDETYLYSVSYEELKTLVMHYPYSANLRILLLKKSYLEQNKDYERNLQMSATYSTNRKHLFKTIKKLKSFQLTPQNVILGEDYLELAELSNIERLLAERQVVQAIHTATREESLAPDWKLEIDDLAFNSAENEEAGFDLEEITQKIDNQLTKPRTEDEEIDSLINSLVTEYAAESADEDTSFDISIDTSSRQVAAQQVEKQHFEESSVMFLPLEESEFLPPSVASESFLDFLDEEAEKSEVEDDIIDNEIMVLTHSKPHESEQIEVKHIETADVITLQTEQKEDVKKANIELEIVNQTKAPIVEKTSIETSLERKPSFTEWLSQFRMTPSVSTTLPNKSESKTAEVLVNQVVTRLDTSDEEARKVSRKNMIDLFEEKADVPDNIFGLTIPVKPKAELQNKAAEIIPEDEDEDDEIFSIESENSRKKRPMHQLAVKSLVEDDELVSETLADLLVWQGNSLKAIEMYRKLILKFPEKSIYFATKIEKISKNP